MTTSKPYVEAYLVTRIKGQGYGKPRRVIDAEVYDVTSDSFFAKGAKENYIVEPLIPLSTYEVLRAENETLHRDVSVLVEALELIAESCDVGRHDGLPEEAPALCATESWLLAKGTLVAYRKQGGDS